MKAFFIDRYGKRNGAMGEVPESVVGEHDVLVRIHAASVTRWTQRSGRGSSS